MSVLLLAALESASRFSNMAYRFSLVYKLMGHQGNR